MEVVFLAIVKLILVVLLGFYLYKRKILKDEALHFLTVFVINFTIPFLIFTNIIDNFYPNTMPSVWLFILLSVLIFSLGLALSYLFSFSVPKTLKREFMSLVSFQNCGYLPMNIVFFLLPSKARSTFLIYIFLYILGFNILMWSVGSFLIFKRREEKFQFKSLLNPPILSIILSLLVVYLGLRRFIPAFILSPLKMIGQTSFVLSMIILGGWLAKSNIIIHSNMPVIIKISILKLIILPLFIFIGILYKGVVSLLGLFIILEACMPSAASLPIVVNLRKADSEFASYGVFFTHLVSIATVPLWIGLFLAISHFNF